MRRTRAGDVAGYLAAAAVLIGGGAVFTRKILTFNRGPMVAVAAIMLTGWVVDRLLSRRGGGDGASEARDEPSGREPSGDEVPGDEVPGDLPSGDEPSGGPSSGAEPSHDTRGASPQDADGGPSPDGSPHPGAGPDAGGDGRGTADGGAPLREDGARPPEGRAEQGPATGPDSRGGRDA